MELVELAEDMSTLLDLHFASEWSTFLPNTAWNIHRADGHASGLVALFEEPFPHVRFKAGVRAEVPLVSDAGRSAAWLNHELWFGRIFLRGDTERGMGYVAIEDLLPCAILAYDFQVSLNHLVAVMKTVMVKALDVESKMTSYGRPFTDEDSYLLLD